ncbi:hypothetical protein RJ641_012609 [Dillenia turbinata]|uniref:Uncharacterized protein n=1 Tax=Dillenia turbinata TaxID=194707 RepID=A0AAN8V3P4_9MAGN
MGSSVSPWQLKALFGALALVGLTCILVATNAASRGIESTNTFATQNFKHMEVVEGEKLPHHPLLDLNYMSKRRVPNGPDPIHNRRAGNSRQPPGQA